MAATSYYVKRHEDELYVEYSYGVTEDDLSRSLLIDKALLRPDVSSDVLGLTGRMALFRIVKTFHERGQWPERGASLI